MDENFTNKKLPMLVLRGNVFMPSTHTNFDVGRIRSLEALSYAKDYDNMLFIVAQKDASIEDPTLDDLYNVGVICVIKKISQLQGINVKVTVDVLYRATIENAEKEKGGYFATVTVMPDVSSAPMEERAYLSVIKELFKDYAKNGLKLQPEALNAILAIERPDEFVNVAASVLALKDSIKQNLLEETIIKNRLQILTDALSDLNSVVEIEKTISDRVKKSFDKSQKEYYLREQLKAIRSELGYSSDDDDEDEDVFHDQILAKNMPKEVEEKCLKELKRMSKMSSSSPDYSVIRTYLDMIIELPFNETTTDTENLSEAIKVLNNDHFGLEKVKERIIEYLAVIKVTNKISGPILCLVGPPGVGKTSVATSIARALNRKFIRMSLGGVKDEAEIRGHRKTYVGSMPGRIMTGIKNVGVINPVFLLDEIDKLSTDLRGDPASALLEVLDPEQNKNFRDRYFEIPYDLSKVLFITTANSLETIPAPLLDRMEVIELEGYTQEEKLEIAKRYLVPKRMDANGLTKKNINFSDSALTSIIKGYTLEAGVRGLEKQIDAVCRKVTTKLAQNEALPIQKILKNNLNNYLGSPRYIKDENMQKDEVGAATGLAWTQFGGTTLTIEVSVMKGKGEILLTGKLGDVMKESARAALSYIHTHAETYGILNETFSTNDIHVHVPEGATPKDGPSAGITIATALLSALTNKPVRKDVAMTGEITLLGRVLPIGGLKEKSLAAFRSGINEIIIPEANKKDLEDIPENIRSKIHFIPVEMVSEVFKIAIRGV